MMSREAELVERFPEIDWREPIPLTVIGECKGFGCRFCIAIYGYKPAENQMRAGVEKAAERASLLMDVVIGSDQTLMRDDRLTRYDPDHFGYIFVDEAHRGSDRNKKITDYFASAKVMGMTATAFRAKRADKS